MPASASPRPTFVRTDFTSCSWLTGVTLTPALPKVVVEYVPQGTPGAQTSTLIAGLARSVTAVMCFGLPGCPATPPHAASSSPAIADVTTDTRPATALLLPAPGLTSGPSRRAP